MMAAQNGADDAGRAMAMQTPLGGVVVVISGVGTVSLVSTRYLQLVLAVCSEQVPRYSGKCDGYVCACRRARSFARGLGSCEFLRPPRR